MSDTEKPQAQLLKGLRISVALIDARDTMQKFLGERYRGRVDEMKAEIRKSAAARGEDPFATAQAYAKLAVDMPVTQGVVFAAMVEFAEEGEKLVQA